MQVSLDLVSKYVPVSQSCAVARSFWQATGQSSVTNRVEDCLFGHSAVIVDYFLCAASRLHRKIRYTFGDCA